MFKKGDNVIYTACRIEREVKIISNKVMLAYNGGYGYNIKFSDGNKYYVSEKSLSVKSAKI
jgi:hypothetical protein